MSASLVGSEMCIRDSCLTIPTEMHTHSVKSVRPPTQWTYGKPQAATPVSYTHLTLPTICSV
eukprot:1924467-Alexandrium_andersonii.AAC.1